FVLISLCVYFGRNDLGLSAHSTLATIGLLCVCAIEYHDHFLNLRICNHLLHELYCVMAFFEVPLVHGYVDAVLSELSRKIEDPCLVLVRTPTVGNERFWIRCHTSPNWPRMIDRLVTTVQVSPTRDLPAHQGGAGGHRLHLGEGDGPRQVFHAAIGRDDKAFGRHKV